MRRILVSLVIMAMLAPTVSAHGANTFAFVMRGESLQPESAQVLQNDTLIFYNVVDYERRIMLDVESDGVYEINCTTGASSPGIEDECRVWVNPINWTSGDYEIDIFSNGSFWKTLRLSILLDDHTENVAPIGYSFNNDQGESELDGDSDFLALALIALAFTVVVFVRKRGDYDE